MVCRDEYRLKTVSAGCLNVECNQPPGADRDVTAIGLMK